MLDDQNVLKQRDPQDALGIAANQWEQAKYTVDVQNGPRGAKPLTKIIVAGMGGSALAAGVAQAWLAKRLTIPIEVVRTYDLPNYIDDQTLVIASSYSGNTEETVSCLQQARDKSAQIAVIASGGKLLETATADSLRCPASIC